MGWRGCRCFARHAPPPAHTPRTSTALCLCRLVEHSFVSRFLSFASLISCLSRVSCLLSVLFYFCLASVLCLSCLVSVSFLCASLCLCQCLSLSCRLSVPVCSCEEFDMCASFRVFNVQAQRMLMLGHVHLQPSAMLRMLEERAQVSRPERCGTMPEQSNVGLCV